MLSVAMVKGSEKLVFLEHRILVQEGKKVPEIVVMAEQQCEYD